MWASYNGHQDTGNVLLQHGADVAVKDNVSTLCVMSTPTIDDVNVSRDAPPPVVSTTFAHQHTCMSHVIVAQ